MAIKSKGWTARLPVKICCFILIPVMAFVFLLGILALARMDLSNADERLLFTEFKNSDYFFDSHVPAALSNVQTVFSYQSEEHIKDMGCLAWEPIVESYASTVVIYEETAQNSASMDESYYLRDENGEIWYELRPTDPAHMGQSWGMVKKSDLESPEAERLKNGAIQNQLNEYRRAKELLEAQNGLYYYMTDGKMIFTNMPDENNNADFYKSQPVFLTEVDGLQEHSRGNAYSAYNNYYGYGYGIENTIVYLAYSQEAVNAQNAEMQVVQKAFAANIALIAGATLVALTLLIILMAGAGRRSTDGGEAVHFTVLDKPWLDISLYAAIGLEAAICASIIYAIQTAWQYDNIRAIILLFALLSVGFTLPVLWWILSFTKRCKAGKWWRHTMFYWVWDKCVSFVKSLWAGFPLTAKAVGAAFAILCAMAVCAVAPPEAGAPMGGIFSVSIALFFLQYAKKLRLVEQGAKAASVGRYDMPISVKGGELGSIADSINSISEGINAAVAERMKSERLKTELITNVSHDIRTPLTSLITYTDLLKNEGLDSERAPEYLEVLIQKSARLKALTDDLFEASKAASGNIEVHMDTLDLSDFVRQVLGELDERVNASGLDFRMNLPEHAPVLADGKLLWRVMENLLSNVFKYALKGSRVYIDVTQGDGGYRLDVKNISENPLNVDPDELTERFKRGDGARAGEGSGLGLSIAQSFVHAQGGRFALAIDGDLFKATVYLPKP